MSNDNETNLQQDELATLKARADMLSVTYHPSIGVDKLKEKIAAALAEPAGNAASNDTAVAEPVAPTGAQNLAPFTALAAALTPAAAPVEETLGMKRKRLKNDLLALVRIRLTCMNPAKAEWEGEIFTAGNSLIGSVTKYVPFNNEEGWHVPKIILNQLQDRRCQIFTTDKTKNGVTMRKGKLIKEFAIELLPALTQDELDELAQRQALARSID